MADIIPVKAIRTGADVTALGEMTPTDTISGAIVSNTPAGNIAATTVQAAINELDTEKEAVANKGAANGYASLDANSLIPITQIPPAAVERLVVVADQTARYALTTASVQNGDTVKQTDTGEFWYVIDDTNLANSAGYAVYNAGTASAVALGGVTGLGTGVATALAINVGTAGAPVVLNGALGTPSSGTLDACTTNTEAAGTNNTQLANTAHVYAERANTATLTNKTLTDALATATSTDDDNTLLLSDNKWVQRQISNSIFSKAQAQSVSLTAAASGSTGLTLADNSNLDMGTGNFTPAAKVALPDYTPASEQFLFHKHDGTTGIILSLLTTGIARLTINASTYDSTVAIPATDGVAMLLFPVVVRETATTAGSVTFYFGGKQLGDAVAITAGAPTSVDNASPLYVMGTSAVRTAGRCYGSYLFNRALSATEASLFAKNAVAESDKDGSQTVLNVSTCTSTTNPYATFTGASSTGFTAADPAPANAKNASTAEEIVFISGCAYEITFDATLTSGQAPYVSLRDSQGGTNVSSPTAVGVTSGFNTITLYATTSTTGVVNFNTLALATSYAISNLNVRKLGTTLRLEPEGIQLGYWYDSSSNNLNASYPASGFSFLRQPARLSNKQPTPTACTGTATLTIAQLLTGIVTDTHVSGATATYTLPTATLMDAALPSMQIDDSFEWSLINLSAAAADTATVANGTSHTIIGNAVVQSAHATTGALYGSSGRFRTKKSAVNTYITYRIS